MLTSCPPPPPCLRCQVATQIPQDSIVLADLRGLFLELDPADTGRVPYTRLQVTCPLAAGCTAYRCRRRDDGASSPARPAAWPSCGALVGLVVPSACTACRRYRLHVVQEELEEGTFNLSAAESQQLLAQMDVSPAGDIAFAEFVASLVDWSKVRLAPVCVCVTQAWLSG